jgi:hypothetical protein
MALNTLSYSHRFQCPVALHTEFVAQRPAITVRSFRFAAGSLSSLILEAPKALMSLARILDSVSFQFVSLAPHITSRMPFNFIPSLRLSVNPPNHLFVIHSAVLLSIVNYHVFLQRQPSASIREFVQDAQKSRFVVIVLSMPEWITHPFIFIL